ncbi:MAG: metallophosphoesterase [Clostridia bacterium]|nr:metallophosphoesterase [Clostridia bacterium]
MKKTRRFLATAVSAILCASICISATGCDENGNGAGNSRYYDIVINDDITGGSITADKTRVTAGEEVVLTLSVNSGMVLEYATANGVEISFYDGKYTLFSVADDYVIDASFLPEMATVSFVTGTDEEIEPFQSKLFEAVGELPSPANMKDKNFLGWYDAAEGGNLIKRSSIVKKNDFVLYARWEVLTEEYLNGLVPYSISNHVYHSDLSAYGISYHTTTAATTPTVLLTNITDTDFSEAVEIECSQEYFFEEYICQAVIDVEEQSLEYGEKYLLKVGDTTTEVFSETYTFTVREQPSATETKFVYIADTQQEYYNKYYTSLDGVTYEGGIQEGFALTMMKTAIAANPDFDFVANGGDIVNYGVGNGYWAEMLKDFAGFMFEYPMVVAAGNHEAPNWYSAGKFGIMTKVFNINIPTFGSGNLANGQSGMAFSLDFGPLHFVVLNSNDVFHTNSDNAPSTNSLSNAQLNWLAADLKADKENPKTKFTIAMIHEGPILPSHSSNSGNDHHDGLRGPLMKALYEGQVDLVLTGHKHYYFTSYPLAYDENAVTTIEYSSTSIVDEKYAKVVSKATSTETLNGIEYSVYTDYHSGVEGTVYMGIGSGGSPNRTSTSFNYNNMATLVEKREFFRFLATQGKGSIENVDVNLNMYSYIKVTEDTLTMETYGTPFSANYQKDFAGGDAPVQYLIDALLLRK